MTLNSRDISVLDNRTSINEGILIKYFKATIRLSCPRLTCDVDFMAHFEAIGKFCLLNKIIFDKKNNATCYTNKLVLEIWYLNQIAFTVINN